MDSLLREIKGTRETFNKDNASLEEQIRAIKALQERDLKEA